jgi:hypothetical protein
MTAHNPWLQQEPASATQPLNPTPRTGATTSPACTQRPSGVAGEHGTGGTDGQGTSYIVHRIQAGVGFADTNGADQRLGLQPLIAIDPRPQLGARVDKVRRNEPGDLLSHIVTNRRTTQHEHLEGPGHGLLGRRGGR